MKIYPDTKIYMICPANIHTGGPELCHQLVSQLVQFGLDAYIFYLPSGRNNFNPQNPIDDFYKKYHCPYVLQIKDEPQNILIINESSSWIYPFFKFVRKIFWWMSVDNYISNIAKLISDRKNDALKSPLFNFFYFQNDETEHWVQSEYARQFVLLNGVPQKKVYFVEDYLNQTFLSKAKNINLSAKQNIVAFNPLKGFETTKKLVNLSPKMHWGAIKDMTPKQVQDLLAASKVYIDFGNHPGKDRIPREAALSGCVVITGKRGAAANNIDINIPDEFKFDETENDLPRIMNKILDVFENFEENYGKQEEYRKRILDDKPRFAKEVAKAFKINPPKIDSIAVAQGISQKGLNCMKALNKHGYSSNIKFLIDHRFCDSVKSPQFDLVRTFNNSNYFYDESMKNGRGYNTVIISAEEAKFLYAEGRITKFALFDPVAEELDVMNKLINPRSEDFMILNIE